MPSTNLTVRIGRLGVERRVKAVLLQLILTWGLKGHRHRSSLGVLGRSIFYSALRYSSVANLGVDQRTMLDNKVRQIS
jgi:hypothetical protein